MGILNAFMGSCGRPGLGELVVNIYTKETDKVKLEAGIYPILTGVAEILQSLNTLLGLLDSCL